MKEHYQDIDKVPNQQPKQRNKETMDERKRMDIKEFREKGYLQELNRQFLHPLGLALEVIVDFENGSERLGGIWDSRDDPEGIIFDIENNNEERKEKFRKNEEFIENQITKRISQRINSLGFGIEPIE